MAHTQISSKECAFHGNEADDDAHPHHHPRLHPYAHPRQHTQVSHKSSSIKRASVETRTRQKCPPKSGTPRVERCVSGDLGSKDFACEASKCRQRVTDHAVIIHIQHKTPAPDQTYISVEHRDRNREMRGGAVSSDLRLSDR